ncbi:CAP domain-containing protein [Sulfurovum sp.]|uniref:CAP domain-containing protein n=1 Tax=Sulfurovum sp. TaxID=1969726 RepID=UPI0025F1128B|nr:CAP domain-containing protein [Sulfurovum sp.]
MIVKIFVPIVMAAFMAGCSSGGSATYSAVSHATHGAYNVGNSNPYRAPHLSTSMKHAYLQAINKARSTSRRCGSEGYFSAAGNLKWSDALYKAAYEHSNDLAQTDTFNHRGSGRVTDHTGEVLGLRRGSTFKERIINNGYTNPKAISENITAGTVRDTAQKAVEAWIASDRHCANLMNPSFREVGMAHVQKAGTTYTHYWTQNLGKTR